MRGLLSAVIAVLALSLFPFAALAASPAGDGTLKLERATAAISPADTGWQAVVRHSAPHNGISKQDLSAFAAQLRNEREPQFVFGGDDRFRRSPAEARVAWIWAVFDDGSGAFDEPDLETTFVCTSTLVSATVLLTAAHCLHVQELGGWPDWIIIWPGADGQSLPYGPYIAENWAVPVPWVDAEDFVYDFGFIMLQSTDDIGNDLGWMPIGVLNDASLGIADLWATTIGYPGDKEIGTQWETSTPHLDEIFAEDFTSQLDQVQGQSGSPIFRQSDEAIFGVISHGLTNASGEFNVSRRITQGVIDFGLGACQEVGCSISYFVDGQGGPPNTGPEPGPEPTPGERPTGPAQPIDGCQYFPETQHNLCEPFLSYWRGNGGLPVFGFPTTEPFNETNADLDQVFLTQYFERERMEHHPDNAGTPYEILLGRLGHEVLLLQGRDWSTFPKADPSAAHYYAETGHAIAPEFWEYWSNHGLEFGHEGVSDQESLALFGLPLSEPAMETNSSGDTVLTQWYERARFEYHPDSAPGLQVKLGLLGNEFLAADQTPGPPAPEPPSDGVPVEGEVIGSADLSQWQPFEAQSGDYGEPTEEGYAIVNVPDSGLPIVADAEFGDASYSVRMRVLDPAPVGLACLSARVTASPENPNIIGDFYELCAVYSVLDGSTAPMILGFAASYVSFATEVPQVVDLGVWSLADPVPATDWHELKIIAQGSSFWFLFDGNLLGSAEHSGPASGLVGFSAWNFTTIPEPQTAQAQILNALASSALADRLPLGIPAGASRVEFADLIVRALQ